MSIGDEHVKVAKDIIKNKGYAYISVGFTVEPDGQFSLFFWKRMKHKKITYPNKITNEDLRKLLNNALDDIEILFTMDTL